jgi:hypothetical protein
VPQAHNEGVAVRQKQIHQAGVNGVHLAITSRWRDKP